MSITPNNKIKQADKWVGVPQCYTVVVEHAIVMFVLDLNSLISHCVRKMILSEDGVSL